jgi:cyclophilin family peptidyl-prolyl cis-trans isomerase
VERIGRCTPSLMPPAAPTRLPRRRCRRRHKVAGTVSMAPPNGSQFLITARDDCDALDDKATVFGHVVDGMDVVMK